MAVVFPAAVNRIFQEFNSTMLSQINESPAVWKSFAMEVPSSSRSTLYAWLYDQAVVREFKGGRYLNDFEAVSYELVNRNWEISWKFSEYQLRDDLSGLTAQAIQMGRTYGQKWIRHQDTLIATTIQAGKTTLCYDGQNFFSASHPTDFFGITSGTFSNLRTTSALTLANYNAACIQMLGYKLPDGSPWVGPGAKIKLMYEQSNALAAAQILNTPYLTVAAAYGLANTTGPSPTIRVLDAEPILNQYLASEAGTWYLVAEIDGQRPIIFQRRQDVEVSELGPGSDIWFDRKEYNIGQDARYAAGFSHPQLMIRNEP